MPELSLLYVPLKRQSSGSMHSLISAHRPHACTIVNIGCTRAYAAKLTEYFIYFLKKEIWWRIKGGEAIGGGDGGGGGGGCVCVCGTPQQ